jgi:threonine/homoserine/homoserine lactone efflux protein
MEGIYCSIAFTGFASFFTQGVVKTVMEIFSFGFMMFLGIKFLMVKSVPAADGYRSRFEKKFEPHSAFMTGFMRTLGNPGLLLFWIVVSANFMWRGWVQPRLGDKAACILCVALGTCLWFSGLSYAISVGGRKMSDKTLLRIERGSGAALVGLGLVHGGQIVVELMRSHK